MSGRTPAFITMSRCKSCEIERSIVLENSTIRDLNVRLHGCLIGRDVTVQRKDEKPRALTLNLGDHSTDFDGLIIKHVDSL